MSQELTALLGEDFGSISLTDGGNEFAEKVVASAKKHHINLQSIPELKYADLDGDGKIEAKEIAALIYTAHKKRAGQEFQIVSSGDGLIDGQAVPNPDFDPAITVTDIRAMMDQNIVGQAKLSFQLSKSVPTVEQLLHAIDKEVLDSFKSIKGGINANQDTRDSSSLVGSYIEKSNAFKR